MKSARNVSLVKHLITKRTTTTTSSAKANAEPVNLYETCPHAVIGAVGNVDASASTANLHHLDANVVENVRPYSEVPGPKPLPILGNTWR